MAERMSVAKTKLCGRTERVSRTLPSAPGGSSHSWLGRLDLIEYRLRRHVAVTSPSSSSASGPDPQSISDTGGEREQLGDLVLGQKADLQVEIGAPTASPPSGSG